MNPFKHWGVTSHESNIAGIQQEINIARITLSLGRPFDPGHESVLADTSLCAKYMRQHGGLRSCRGCPVNDVTSVGCTGGYREQWSASFKEEGFSLRTRSLVSKDLHFFETLLTAYQEQAAKDLG